MPREAYPRESRAHEPTRRDGLSAICLVLLSFASVALVGSHRQGHSTTRSAPLADHHQHLFSPELAALMSTTPPVAAAKPRTAADLVAQLDAAGIRRAVVLSTVYIFEQPSRKVDGAAEQLRRENDWTSRQVAQFPGPVDRVLRSQPAEGLRTRGARALRRRPEPPPRPQAASGQLGRRLPQSRAHRTGSKSVSRGKRPSHGHRGTRARVGDGKPAVRTRRGRHLPGSSSCPRLPTWSCRWHISPARDRRKTRAHSRRSKCLPMRWRSATRARVCSISMSPHWARLSRRSSGRRWAAAIRQIGPERVLFGSDATLPSATPADAWAALRKQLPLTEREFRTIANNVPPYLR